MPLVVSPRQCTGCRTCELACALAHGGPTAMPRVRVAAAGALHAPLLCLQCDAAACVAVCPVRALERDEATGAIAHRAERCIACEACVIACPFGNIWLAPRAGILKCDLCGGDPACARFCPSGTLRFEPLLEEAAHG